ncbi:MAG: hypothetical protein H6603_01480 [Flavobacteriales bacterium]|nr:hypothetical protein [Flavobacteriales bacterium]MCB9191717.1 hypothetical protein [Flavobacteriales bacterium]MCB9203621.1 hypothetical protein [Flavobacteriales bacterium]
MDDEISNEEIMWLNDALLTFKKKNETRRGWEVPLRTFIDSIEGSHSYHLNTTEVGLNSKSQLLFEVLNDAVIDSMDVILLKKWNETTEMDKLWYIQVNTDSTSFEAQLDVAKTAFLQDFGKLISPQDSLLSNALSNTLYVEDQQVRIALKQLFSTSDLE